MDSYIKVSGTGSEAEIKEALDRSKGRFFRIHKSYLVNFEHIVRLGSAEVEMSDKKILPISRIYRKEVSEQMKKLMKAW